MRVYVFPAGLDGCAYYRLIWPAEILAKAGHDVSVIMPSMRDDPMFGIKGAVRGDELLDIHVPADADVIVFQRVTHKLLHQGIKLIRRKGIAVVVDMDDDLSRVAASNPAAAWLRPGNGTEHSFMHAQQACDDATLVTTSTEQLQRVYARHGRGRVLHNYIPAHAAQVERDDDGYFGWTGTLFSHSDDPLVVGSAVQRLTNEGFRYLHVGNNDGIRKVFNITADIQSTGITDIMDWFTAVGKLHVGMAPLADTMFNSAKSWLKPLELGALGIPCVMSPRTEYRKIANLGIGVMAKSPKEWYRELKRLMTDDTHYAEVSQRTLATANTLQLVDHAWRWAEVWREAHEIERSQHSPIGYRGGLKSASNL